MQSRICDKCHKPLPVKIDPDGTRHTSVHTIIDKKTTKVICDRCYQRYETGV